MVTWSLLLAVMLLPLGGVSVDLWHGIEVQRQLQSAAEDAALAGASGIDVGTYRESGCIALDPTLAVPLAEGNIASQPGLGALAGTDIVVSPDQRQISVLLKEDLHLTLLAWFEGPKPLVVVATASSGPEGSVSGRGCA
jgi:Flp pilus assembly protein TadG